MSTTMNTPDARRGRWIPWAFVGGMLLVVAVNAVLIVSAVSTFTGVTTGQAYDRGRAYNQVLAEAGRQDALGWSSTVTLSAEGLLVRVQDRAGRPVSGQLSGVLRRPLEGLDLPVELMQAAPGQWVAGLEAIRPGQWEARLRLTGPGGEALDIRQRLMAP